MHSAAVTLPSLSVACPFSPYSIFLLANLTVPSLPLCLVLQDLLSLMSSSPEPGVVLRLVPIPLQDQAMALAGQGDFHSALALVGMLPEDKPTRQGRGQGEGQAEAAAEAECKLVAETGASAVLQKALRSAQGGARPGVDDSGARSLAAASASTRLEKGGEPAAGDAAGEGITAGDGASAGGVDETPALASVSAVQQPGQSNIDKGSARPVGRRELEQRLRLMYGHHLFAGGECDEGMAQIALCSGTDALLYLRLFPSLVSERNRPLLPTSVHGVTLPQVSEPEGKARPAAVATLLPYVLSHRSRALARLGEVTGARGRGSAGATAEAGAEKLEADGRVGDAEAQAVTPEQQLLSIIDTAIVRVRPHWLGECKGRAGAGETCRQATWLRVKVGGWVGCTACVSAVSAAWQHRLCHVQAWLRKQAAFACSVDVS